MLFKRDLNKLAKEVALEEGMKEQVSIAQIKEIMKILFTKLAEMDMYELAKTLKRYK